MLFTKNLASKKRIIEEWVYELVAEELDKGDIRKGLWTKAKGLSEGSEKKCESIYIQLRAESIVDEAKVIHEANNIQKKEESKDKKTKNATNRYEKSNHVIPRVNVTNANQRNKPPVKKDTPEGVGGWLLLIIVLLVFIHPLLGIGRIGADISVAEYNNADLIYSDMWESYKSTVWFWFIFQASLKIYTGFILFKHREESVIKKATVLVWISGPILVFLSGIYLSTTFNLLISNIGNVVGSAIWAIVITFYLTNSKRVKATYVEQASHVQGKIDSKRSPLYSIDEQQEPLGSQKPEFEQHTCDTDVTSNNNTTFNDQNNEVDYEIVSKIVKVGGSEFFDVQYNGDVVSVEYISNDCCKINGEIVNGYNAKSPTEFGDIIKYKPKFKIMKSSMQPGDTDKLEILYNGKIYKVDYISQNKCYVNNTKVFGYDAKCMSEFEEILSKYRLT